MSTRSHDVPIAVHRATRDLAPHTALASAAVFVALDATPCDFASIQAPDGKAMLVKLVLDDAQSPPPRPTGAVASPVPPAQNQLRQSDACLFIHVDSQTSTSMGSSESVGVVLATATCVRASAVRIWDELTLEVPSQWPGALPSREEVLFELCVERPLGVHTWHTGCKCACALFRVWGLCNCTAVVVPLVPSRAAPRAILTSSRTDKRTTLARTRPRPTLLCVCGESSILARQCASSVLTHMTSSLTLSPRMAS